MIRGFNKISFAQFSKDIVNDKTMYSEYELPTRATNGSAGYDFKAIDKIIIKPGEVLMIPTGIKAYMLDDEAMYIIIRSSIGYKHNIVLANQTGVIDSDYFNNLKNEGHIFMPLRNLGNSDFILEKGQPYAQGIFTKYLKIDNEQDIITKRNGGFGSTSRKDDQNE